MKSKRRRRTPAGQPGALKIWVLTHYGYFKRTGIEEVKVEASTFNQAAWKFWRGEKDGSLLWKDTAKPKSYPRELYRYYHYFKGGVDEVAIHEVAPIRQEAQPVLLRPPKPPYKIPQLHGH